jgi:hypothetical protein
LSTIFDEQEYLILNSDIPLQVENQNAYEGLKSFRDFLQDFLNLAYFSPIIVHFFAPMPTDLLWRLSNTLQILNSLNFMQIRLPGNFLVINEALDDFIHLRSISSDWLYNSYVKPWLGHFNEPDKLKLKAIGHDRYIKFYGVNIVRSMCILFFALPLLLVFISFLLCFKE